MAPTTLLEFGRGISLIDASILVAAGDAYALPVRAAVIGVQFTVDVNVGNFTVLLQISLDGTNWFTIKSMTQADLVSTGYFTNLTGPYSGMFLRGNVTVNSVPHAVTLKVVLKSY